LRELGLEVKRGRSGTVAAWRQVDASHRSTDFVANVIAALSEKVPVVLVDQSQRERARIAGAGDDPPRLAPGFEDAAYLMLTSGTSGPPKLAGVSRQSLANHISGYIRLLHLTSRDTVLGFSSATFDGF
jgi:non-ribosomal peptide synthetase component F